MRANIELGTIIGFAVGSLLVACSGSAGTASAPATVSNAIHVDADAPDGGDGASWTSAINDLSLAIEVARAGDEIWVAEGTYRPALPDGDRLASFVLKSGVALYGGFVGNETERAQRDVTAHPTILSGDLDGDDGNLFQNMQENSIHVVMALDLEDSVLDGFTVESGRADGLVHGDTRDSQDQGAAVDIFGGHPVFRDCTFQKNWMSDHGSVNDHGTGTTFDHCMWCANHAQAIGAGLYIHTDAMTSVVDCMFLDNEAVLDGGGTYCRSVAGTQFLGCAWRGNAANQGAGMFNSEASGAHVEQCDFTLNVAGNGGGGVFCERSVTVVAHCTFANNSAGLDVVVGGGGGGGSGGGGFWSTGGSPLVQSCTFQHNAASFGGGVYHIEDSAAVVVDCDLIENTAGEGAGLYTLTSPSHTSGCRFVGNVASGTNFSVGGGMSNYFSNSVVDDCLFRGNRAQLGGGGMYCEGETPLFTGLRFEGNVAFGETEGFGGGLLDGYHTSARVVNCTFALNRAKKGGGIHEMFASSSTVVNCSFAGNVAHKGGSVFANDDSLCRYCNCVMWGGSPAEHAGPIEFEYGCMEDVSAGAFGSFAMDPMFVRMPSAGMDLVLGTGDDDYGDLHLMPGSPCIDAGWNRFVPGDVVTDADGAGRFVDDGAMPNVSPGPKAPVDIGAFEVH
jgi:hypothetical protein